MGSPPRARSRPRCQPPPPTTAPPPRGSSTRWRTLPSSWTRRVGCSRGTTLPGRTWRSPSERAGRHSKCSGSPITPSGPRASRSCDGVADGAAGGAAALLVWRPSGRLDPVDLELQRARLVARIAPGVAHDVANSLAGVSGFAGLLRDDPAVVAEYGDETLALLESGGQAAMGLVRGLTALARDGRPGTEQVEVGELLAEVLRLVDHRLVDVRLGVDLPVGPSRGPGEPRRAPPGAHGDRPQRPRGAGPAATHGLARCGRPAGGPRRRTGGGAHLRGRRTDGPAGRSGLPVRRTASSTAAPLVREWTSRRPASSSRQAAGPSATRKGPTGATASWPP